MDPSDWKFGPLKDLDGLLRCPICFEYFNTAVMMPACSHNYCSLCIRRFLEKKQQCPTCSKPAMEGDLRCNRLLDELIHSFTSNREAFMTLTHLHTLAKGPAVAPPTEGQGTSGKLNAGRSQQPNAQATKKRQRETPPTEGQGTSSKLNADGRSQQPAAHAKKRQRETPPTEGQGTSGKLNADGRSQQPVAHANAHASVQVTLRNGRDKIRGSEEKLESGIQGSEGKSDVRVPLKPRPTEGRLHVPKPPSLIMNLADLDSQEILEGMATPPSSVATVANTVPAITSAPHLKLATPPPPVAMVNTGTTVAPPLPTTPPPPVAITSRVGRTTAEITSQTGRMESCRDQPSANGVSEPRQSAAVSPVGGVARGVVSPHTTSPPILNGMPANSSESEVECPVCGVKTKNRFINSHLDLCLNGSLISSTSNTNSGSTPSTGGALQGVSYNRKGSLPRLPKMVFSIMTDKQLKKQLRGYSLSTLGHRNTLIARLKEFTLQYKAESDSLNPKSVKEIAHDVEEGERERAGAKRPPSLNSSITLLSRRNASASDIDEERKNYEISHDEHFAKLIAGVKRKGKSRVNGVNHSTTVSTSNRGGAAAQDHHCSLTGQRSLQAGGGVDMVLAKQSPEISEAMEFDFDLTTSTIPESPTTPPLYATMPNTSSVTTPTHAPLQVRASARRKRKISALSDSIHYLDQVDTPPQGEGSKVTGQHSDLDFTLNNTPHGNSKKLRRRQ